MKQFLKRYGLFFLGIIFDFFASGLLPSSFGYDGFIVVPYFGFAALILVTRKLDLVRKLVISFLYGVFIEMQLFDTSFVPIISIMLIAFLTHLVQDIFSNTFLEKGILLFFAISLLEITIYVISTVINKISIGFVSYLTYQFILTMIFNIVVIFIMLLIESLFIDRQIQKQRIKKKREHISLLE